MCLQDSGRNRGEWAGPPRTHRAAWRTACPEKGKTRIAGLEEVPTRMGPEHGAVTRASVRPLTPNPPPPAKAPRPKGAGRGAARLRKGSWQMGPSTGVPVHSPGSCSEGPVTRGRAARGRRRPHRVEERGRHLVVLLRFAWSRGQSRAPPGFSAHGVCVQKGTRPTRTCTPDGAKKRVAKGGGCRDGPAVGSAGAWELGGRPARREQGALSPTNSL